MTAKINERAIANEIRKTYAVRRKEKALQHPITDEQEDAEKESSAAQEIEAELGWKQQILGSILTMPPEAFERLSQRLLRESGFTQVEVTGRSGDGGIDGKVDVDWFKTV
jgi:restriction system protein